MCIKKAHNFDMSKECKCFCLCLSEFIKTKTKKCVLERNLLKEKDLILFAERSCLQIAVLCRRLLVFGEHLFSVLFLCAFSEKVKLLCISDSTETLSLRIQLDYSGQTMKINQKYFSFQRRSTVLPDIYNNCIVTAVASARTRPDAEHAVIALFRYKLHDE